MYRYICIHVQDEAKDAPNEAQDGHDKGQDGQDEAQEGQDQAQDGQDEAFWRGGCVHTLVLGKIKKKTMKTSWQRSYV